uniref:Methyl-CpG-binding domain protein 1 n=1 Tax=Catharus ustulatus TaxID=91951 RepID=A0A8C3UXA4_CATUS
MAEGWAECPALGPGWQRREAFRKSGATSGRSDTYYRSPTGQKFRSKIELRRFLGPGHDLSNFDFKSGLQRPSHTRVRGFGTWEGLCASCHTLFPGVSLPPQRRCRWLCPDCRGELRPQRPPLHSESSPTFLSSPRRVGCGSCQACRIPEDCGICSACARNPPGAPAGPGRAPKCLLRRCLRIVKKGLGCGSCSGCLSTEDCGSCCICLRRLQPGLKRQWRCLRRRCLRPKGKEKKKPGRPPKPPGPRGVSDRCWPRPLHPCRASRRCGVCAACRRPADCGRCDFCRDKPKFGGQNLKRQKCRWRQCLRCAMVGAPHDSRLLRLGKLRHAQRFRLPPTARPGAGCSPVWTSMNKFGVGEGEGRVLIGTQVAPGHLGLVFWGGEGGCPDAWVLPALPPPAPLPHQGGGWTPPPPRGETPWPPGTLPGHLGPPCDPPCPPGPPPGAPHRLSPPPQRGPPGAQRRPTKGEWDPKNPPEPPQRAWDPPITPLPLFFAAPPGGFGGPDRRHPPREAGAAAAQRIPGAGKGGNWDLGGGLWDLGGVPVVWGGP